jgi:hypothetical protein
VALIVPSLAAAVQPQVQETAMSDLSESVRALKIKTALFVVAFLVAIPLVVGGACGAHIVQGLGDTSELHGTSWSTRVWIAFENTALGALGALLGMVAGLVF